MILQNNIFVAFASEKVAGKVAAMLKTGGLYPSVICHMGSTLLARLNQYDEGVIVCGTRFKDTVLFDVMDFIPDYFHIVTVGTMDVLDDLPNNRVFKLTIPLNRTDLIYSVSMLLNLNNHRALIHNQFRSEDEEMIIQQAKGILIHKYHMTEEQAHRYMQTKSMNTGKKMINIARLILN
ncbi:MAG: ANTAR domain-containing protein [Clostridiales bacterium]|nr:ANTAR domain-containing protein [Clostridiales bacterium]